jgi:hypothetical protein
MTPAELSALVAHVDPMSAKYLRRDVNGDGREDTFCNVFAADVCSMAGVALPMTLADKQIAWLDSEDARSRGWMRVDAVDAKRASTAGALTLATWANMKGHGHIGVLVPSDSDEIWMAQAGGRNFLRGPLAAGFGSLPVRFFTQGKP